MTTYVWAKDGQMPVCMIRGWGHLTGVGGMHLSEDVALAVQQANARLIAAAPDLLAALKALLFLYGETGNAVVERAAAAVVKAEGQE